MATTPRALDGWSALAALAAAGCMGLSPMAINAPAWVRNALNLGRNDQMHDVPVSARFSTDEGDWFVLDRSQKPTLLRFGYDPDEVWVVSPSRGPRGDILYKDDIGDVLLRVTKFGGVTVFTSRRPMGAAATLDGRSQPIHVLPIGVAGLYQRMILASARCTRAVHHLVAFDASDADSRSAAELAEAAILAMNAILTVAARPQGRSAVARIGRVMLLRGAKPDVWLRQGVLSVQVTPGAVFSGHPSSARIIQAIDASN